MSVLHFHNRTPAETATYQTCITDTATISCFLSIATSKITRTLPLIAVPFPPFFPIYLNFLTFSKITSGCFGFSNPTDLHFFFFRKFFLFAKSVPVFFISKKLLILFSRYFHSCFFLRSCYNKRKYLMYRGERF